MIENFLGKDGFVWWIGVVENNQDPLNLGRCQVRMFGWHTDNKSLLPTSDLPWALPGNSPNQSMTSAVPLVGDYCFGFFGDGKSAQMPYVLSVFPGIPVKGANQQIGFSEGTFYPVDEPTTSRLYRNENVASTVIGQHNSSLDTDVPTSSGGSWSEPASKYATIPPYNRVTQTLAHVFELDDTPGAERIHLNHKTNTFFEIAPDGSMVTKVQGENFSVYVKDNNVYVKGNCNITVDGNADLYVKGNLVEKVDGNITRNISGSVTETISGTYTGSASSWNLTGNINETGVITASGDVIGGGISLDNHTHPDPQGGNTGPPQ